jgi:hypothetical protein
LQVTVAVLLDNFVSASARIDEEEKRVEREQKLRLQQVRGDWPMEIETRSFQMQINLSQIIV